LKNKPVTQQRSNRQRAQNSTILFNTFSPYDLNQMTLSSKRIPIQGLTGAIIQLRGA
jgi:hypothetical protein